jgi:hypothetical protein
VNALQRGLFAVGCCGVAVFSGARVLLGGLRAQARSTLAFGGREHDDLRAADRAGAVVVLVGGVALGELEVARVGGLVSRERLQVTCVRDHVTLIGGIQARLRALIASGASAPARVLAR